MTDLVNWTLRVLRPNDGSRRKGVLVFTRFVRESAFLVDCLRKKGVTAVVVSGDTPKRERNQIVADFKAGRIQVLANANVFSMGFDYPALDTVIIAHPTRSLARWYQQIRSRRHSMLSRMLLRTVQLSSSAARYLSMPI